MPVMWKEGEIMLWIIAIIIILVIVAALLYLVGMSLDMLDESDR